jgi:hypothetical protein
MMKDKRGRRLQTRKDTQNTQTPKPTGDDEFTTKLQQQKITH